jgi:hypothetical protein
MKTGDERKFGVREAKKRPDGRRFHTCHAAAAVSATFFL